MADWSTISALATAGGNARARFAVIAVGDSGWLSSVPRHWNIDRADPR